MANDEKKYASGAGELKETDCHTDRKTVSSISNKAGEIFMIDNVNFGIRAEGTVQPLIPCNLPIPLQKAGKKIIFSGVIKAVGLAELWAGQPFVLTSAKEQ